VPWPCPQILRSNWKGFPRENPLAYWVLSSVTKEKSFITLTPEHRHARPIFWQGRSQRHRSRHAQAEVRRGGAGKRQVRDFRRNREAALSPGIERDAIFRPLRDDPVRSVTPGLRRADRALRDAGRRGKTDLCKEPEQGHVTVGLPRRQTEAGRSGGSADEKLSPSMNVLKNLFRLRHR